MLVISCRMTMFAGTVAGLDGILPSQEEDAVPLEGSLAAPAVEPAENFHGLDSGVTARN